MLQWKEPFAKWFVGGQLNVSYNCLDRHLGTPTANKAALIWEGEPAGPGKPGEQRTFTYKQLHHEVACSPMRLTSGIKRGDRVPFTCRWCRRPRGPCSPARVGAVHSVVFGGFSTIGGRSNPGLGGPVCYHRRWRIPSRQRGSSEANVDGVNAQDAQRRLLAKTIEKVFCSARGNEVQFQQGRDVWWR